MGERSNIILAIDQGTTGTTCLVIALNQKQAPKVCVLGKGYAEIPQHFPKAEWVEHDLDEIWMSVLHATKMALENAKTQANNIAAIGITNQRETIGMWDMQGVPLHHAIVWQDRRTAAQCEQLKSQGMAESIHQRTGLVIDPYFSGTKIGWLVNEFSEIKNKIAAGQVRIGTMDTWLVSKLTNQQTYVTDATNACRTQLFDIQKLAWDKELCQKIAGIQVHVLPEVKTSSEIYGHTKGLEILPDGIPIAGMAGDQHAALFGQACFEPGMAKCTYGTGAFALVNTGTTPVFDTQGLVTTVAWKLGAKTDYALEGSVFVAGAAVQWLRDGLGIISSSEEVEALAASVPDADGVVFVPALTGLGAPHWCPQAKGMITGLSRRTTKAHLARATLNGIAFQICDLVGLMKQDIQTPLAVLRVDGGASANNLLMQFQADMLNLEIHRPKILETTALGAAFLAALGVGIFSDVSEVAKAFEMDRIFSPNMDAQEKEKHLQTWSTAVKKNTM